MRASERYCNGGHIIVCLSTSVGHTVLRVNPNVNRGLRVTMIIDNEDGQFRLLSQKTVNYIVYKLQTFHSYSCETQIQSGESPPLCGSKMTPSLCVLTWWERKMSSLGPVFMKMLIPIMEFFLHDLITS